MTSHSQVKRATSRKSFRHHPKLISMTWKQWRNQIQMVMNIVWTKSTTNRWIEWGKRLWYLRDNFKKNRKHVSKDVKLLELKNQNLNLLKTLSRKKEINGFQKNLRPHNLLIHTRVKFISRIQFSHQELMVFEIVQTLTRMVNWYDLHSLLMMTK